MMLFTLRFLREIRYKFSLIFPIKLKMKFIVFHRFNRNLWLLQSKLICEHLIVILNTEFEVIKFLSIVNKCGKKKLIQVLNRLQSASTFNF